MQTQIMPMSAVRREARWVPESFLSALSARAVQAYPLVALRALVVERKESLDPQAYPAHLFNYLGLEHVQSITGDLVDFTPRKGKEVRSRSKIFRRGDLLYGRLRPYLNKVYLADGRASSGICSGEFHVLIPKTAQVLPHFLRAVLSLEDVQRYVAGRQTGTALPRIHLDDLLAIEIPIPPLNIQQVYEDFLSREEDRRRRLAAEATALPQVTLDIVAAALASGDRPHMPAWRPDASDEVDICSLPDGPLLMQGRLADVE